jgi:hypothetical protein
MRFDAADMRHMGDSTEYIEWQCPPSDIRSIMMEKSAQPGEGGGVHAPPSLSLYQPPRAKLRGQIHFPCFYSIYSVEDCVASYAQQQYIVRCLLVLRIFDF